MMYSQDPIDAAIDALNEYSIAIPICEGYQFNLSDMREAMQAAIAAYLDAMPSPLYHCESVREAEQRSTAELATLRTRAERAEQDARFAVEALLLHNKDALPMATRMVEMEQALSAAQSTIADLKAEVGRLRDFVGELADEPCSYGDGCPAFVGTRHGTCLHCQALRLLGEVFDPHA